MEKTVKTLKDHPSKYKMIYDQTIEYYSVATELISLARSPKGSLAVYTAKCDKLKSRIPGIMEGLKITFPE